MKRTATLCLALLLSVALLNGNVAAIDKPKPSKDLMDSPVPPGDGPGAEKKAKPCSADCAEPAPTPMPTSAAQALSTFTGLNGEGMGYCVSTVLPDGRPAKVNVPFYRVTAANIEEVREDIGKIFLHLADDYEAHCIMKAVRSVGFEAQLTEAAACTEEARILRAKAGSVRFSWEGRAPVTSDASKPTLIDGGGVNCVCGTPRDAGGTLPPGYGCGGRCGSCWSCG